MLVKLKYNPVMCFDAVTFRWYAVNFEKFDASRFAVNFLLFSVKRRFSECANR